MGEQPRLKLVCEVTLRCLIPSPPSFIAVDIRDQTLTVIMQALPKPNPFILGRPGITDLIIEILLPPLIPGCYASDFWLGYHNTRTIDYIPYALHFEVLQSPSLGRTFPHTIDHGSIVPLSYVTKCSYDAVPEGFCYKSAVHGLRQLGSSRTM